MLERRQLLTKQQTISLKKFADASDKLFELGITSTDSFTGEIGEYYACVAYNLIKSNRSNRAVDGVSATGKKYQVKAKIINSSFSYQIKGLDTKIIDFLIVVYFNHLYELQLILEIPANKITDNEIRISNANINSYRKFNISTLKVPSKNKLAIKNFASAYNEVTNLDFVRNRRLVGEIGEYYASKKLNLKLATSSGQKGYDALDKDGRTVEIKTRRVYNSGRRVSDTRRLNKLKDKTAEFLVVVTLDRDFLCSGMWIMPMANVKNPKSANLSNIKLTKGIQKVDISKPYSNPTKKNLKQNSSAKKLPEILNKDFEQKGCLILLSIIAVSVLTLIIL